MKEIYGLQVSKTGKVYIKDKELKQYINSSGYRYVKFIYGGKNYERFVHRLVALVYLNSKQTKRRCVVNHIDGKKYHNEVGNLEWCTPAYNLKHAIRTGLIPKRIAEAKRFRFKK